MCYHDGMRRAVMLLAMITLLPAAAQDEDERELRRRTIGQWTVVDIAESDGGRLVQLRRRAGGVFLDYQANFWRGNGGVLLSAEVRIGECLSGDRPAPVSFQTDETTAQLRERFRLYFAECGLSPARQARLLRDLDRPHCLFRRWAAEAAAATINENAEIVAHGSDRPAERIRPTYPICRA